MKRKIIFFVLFKVAFFYYPEISGQINNVADEYHWKVISNEYIASQNSQHKRHIVFKKGEEVKKYYCNDFRLSCLLKNQNGKYDTDAPYLFDLRSGKTLSEDAFQCLLRLMIKEEKDKLILLLEPFGQ